MDVIEMSVDSIRVHMPSGQHVVVLKQKDAERFLPIWVGMAEANAIALKITGIKPERPQAHDLMVDMLTTLDVTVSRVVVSELRDDTFHARIIGARAGQEVVFDARPSDAIALAIRVESPIYVVEDVLEQAGVLPDSQSEEGSRLAVFQQMVNDMNLPDLDLPDA
ncbi:MAG TPA: bifunctional nuclease family protein [Candidatus Dormibacteraeota bacterium]|nr:bifunctional nuclease family protein [Candidatus Dormibacteraeota bacterium]